MGERLPYKQRVIGSSPIGPILASQPRNAAVAELADAQDLKSCGTNLPCRFDSGLRHYEKRLHTVFDENQLVCNLFCILHEIYLIFVRGGVSVDTIYSILEEWLFNLIENPYNKGAPRRIIVSVISSRVKPEASGMTCSVAGTSVIRTGTLNDRLVTPLEVVNVLRAVAPGTGNPFK